MKKIILLFIAIVCMTDNAMAGVVVPSDLPTIEALISQHRGQMEDLQDKLTKETTNTANQTLIASVSNKYNIVKQNLDKRIANAYSLLSLAASINYAITKTAHLTSEYEEFAEFIANNAHKKPIILLYASNATYECGKDIKDIKDLYTAMTTQNVNLVKATDEEKLWYINTLISKIDAMNTKIQDAYWWCYVMLGGDIHVDYIWEIMNSDVTNAIAKDVINNMSNL